MTWGKTAFTIILLASSLAYAKIANPWNQPFKPTLSPSESLGDYSAGCLRGAHQLTIDGEGFQVMRLSRNRFFGHPVLLAFIQDLAAKTKIQTGQDILVGDMGQPRGGPTMSGHASHQTGLDVDIWFTQPPVGRVFTLEEREKFGALSMVTPEFEKLTSNWGQNQGELIRLAAESNEVERIFVNPVIKQELCKKSGNAKWLRKVRPWWFHEDHFHVRLKCQKGSPQCLNQAPPPEGDGCGEELVSWFTPETKAKSRYMRTHATPAVMPTLPQACGAVLTEP